MNNFLIYYIITDYYMFNRAINGLIALVRSDMALKQIPCLAAETTLYCVESYVISVIITIICGLVLEQSDWTISVWGWINIVYIMGDFVYDFYTTSGIWYRSRVRGANEWPISYTHKWYENHIQSHPWYNLFITWHL